MKSMPNPQKEDKGGKRKAKGILSVLKSSFETKTQSQSVHHLVPATLLRSP